MSKSTAEIVYDQAVRAVEQSLAQVIGVVALGDEK
jgi:hypothetical protein